MCMMTAEVKRKEGFLYELKKNRALWVMLLPAFAIVIFPDGRAGPRF